MSNVFRLFNTDEHKQHLERIFLYDDGSSRYGIQLSTETNLPFMALCQRCRLYFNELKNEREMLCLYHPGVGIGFSFLARNLSNRGR
jgi:hypothetical protein